MSNLRLPHQNLTRTCSPNHSALCSPVFSRSQRNTHKSIQNFKQQIKQQLATVSTSRNFISQKSQILLKTDKKLQQKIKRKITLLKLQSKMSILSMQRTKFKISRNKSCVRVNIMPNNAGITTEEFQSTTNRFQSISSRRQAGCYIVTSELESFRSYLKIISLNHPKRGKGRKAQILTRRLLDYFIEQKNQKQLKHDLVEIKQISRQLVTCLSNNNHALDLNILRLIDRDIAKLIFNVCYEIYRKKQKGVTHKQLIKINKEIQYTSRRLKFFEITLRTIFDLGKLYSDQMEYQKAFQQYTNAIKLSIFLNNKYYQQIAIDKLGVCKYYLGDSVSAVYFHNNIHHLSQYDLNRVKEQYSNENQIKRLIEQKKQLKYASKKKILVLNQNQKRLMQSQQKQDNKQFKTNESFEERVNIGQFTFEKENRMQFYPIANNAQFKTNLKRIIKIPELRGKIHVLKRNIKKNDTIGTKKYTGESYIVPKASMCSRKQNIGEYNQVCLSHRSYNRNNIENDTAKIQKDSKLLIMTLNYFINQNFMDKQQMIRISEANREENQCQQS